MAAEKYVYKGGSMPKLFTEVDLADPDSLVAEAMRTPVNPIAAGEAKRRIPSPRPLCLCTSRHFSRSFKSEFNL